MRRGLDWMAGMQSSDGGWGAFDVDNTSNLALQDPVLRLRSSHRPAVRGRERARARGARGRTPRMRPSFAAGSTTCSAPSSATDRGGGDGASTTCTARRRCCRRSRRAVCRTVTPGHRTGSRRGSTPSRQTTVASARTSARTTSLRARGRGVATASQTAWALVAYVAAGRAQGAAARRAADFLCVDTARQRRLGRAALHGHRLPDRLHDPLPPLPTPLPAASPSAVSGRLSEEVTACKFPLRSTSPDRPLRRPAEAQGRALSARAHARADARVQHRLHRLREDPRVRVEQGEALRRRVHRLRRPVSRAGRLDLRRRAARLQGHRGRRCGLPRARQDDRPLHERASPRGVPRRLQARPSADLRRPPRRHAGDPRLHLRLPGPVGRRSRRDQEGPRGRLPRDDEHDHLQGDVRRGRHRDDGLPHERRRASTAC